MFVVYIIYSKKLNKYYIGTTDDFQERLQQHNHGLLGPDAFTFDGIPWNEHLIIQGLTSEQAYKIEKHIKKMKSVKYLVDLKKYPEMQEKLKARYE